MAPKRKAATTKAAAKAAAAAKETAKEEAKEEVQEVASPAPVLPEKEEVAEERPPSPKKPKVEEKTDKKKTPTKKGTKAKATKAAPKKKTVAAPKESKSAATSKEKTEEPEEGPKSTSSKVIVIEASKEDNNFKIKATKVESGLKEAVPGLEIKVNPEKPRKGCFEIRDEEGAVLFSLQNLSRPYTKLKNIDVDNTVVEIAAKIQLT